VTSTAPYVYADRWKKANRYGNRLRTAAERRYVFAYLDWMACGAVTEAPEHTQRVTKSRATVIRETIHGFALWGDAV